MKNPENKKARIVLFITGLAIIVSMLSSCTDTIELDVPDSEAQLVVDGWIYDDPTVPSQVKLKLTAPYFSNEESPVVSGATVRLYENGDLVETLQESTTEKGLYPITHLGEVGKSYHIEINLPDGKTYRSNPETITRVSAIRDIYYEYEDGEDGLTAEGYYVYIDTDEPEGEGDHYRWKYYVDGVYQNDRFDLAFAEDDAVDGNEINELDISDPIVFTTSDETTINESGVAIDIESGDTRWEDIVIDQDSVFVRVEQMSTSKEAYEFFFILFEQTSNVGSLFDPPPAPIRGNIVRTDESDLTGLGYFGASSIVSAGVWVKDDFNMASGG